MLTTRAQKDEEISSLSDKMGRAKATFVVDYKGMNVEQVTNVRKKLTALQCEVKVVRNTLAIRALKNHPKSETAIANELVGTNAFVFVYEDISASAKALSQLSDEIENLKLKTGVMEGEKLDKAKIKYLSTLPSKDALRGQLLSVMNAPATQMVRLMSAAPRSFLNVMNAKKDKG
ncbi:MAG: 50S ribosomal protein L10 [Bdellovibrionales bacterium]|nr:50S ribosomal protein L10 [Bdellovibrionales bacterium]